MPEFEYAPAQTIAARIRSDYFPGDRVEVPGKPDLEVELLPDGTAPEDKEELVLDEDGDWQLRTGRDLREAEDTATLRPARDDDDTADESDDPGGSVSEFSPPRVLKPDWIDRLSMIADRVHRYLDKRRIRRERAAREARREALALMESKSKVAGEKQRKGTRSTKPGGSAGPKQLPKSGAKAGGARNGQSAGMGSQGGGRQRSAKSGNEKGRDAAKGGRGGDRAANPQGSGRKPSGGDSGGDRNRGGRRNNKRRRNAPRSGGSAGGDSRTGTRGHDTKRSEPREG